MFKSKDFYIKVKGDYALITDPFSKGGGEKHSYSVPTKQCLTGIVDAVYFKPTIKNIVDEVKVMNPIQTEVMGVRALLNSGKADLNYMSYLTDVCYLIKYHFEWNENRKDLSFDRNVKKHEAIMERSVKRGGRRDVFIGTRECMATVEGMTEKEYKEAESHYQGQTLSFGIMFNSFKYPAEPGGKLYSYFSETIMRDGIIQYKLQKDCEIKNELDTYSFKYPEQIKPAEEEYNKEN